MHWGDYGYALHVLIYLATLGKAMIRSVCASNAAKLSKICGSFWNIWQCSSAAMKSHHVNCKCVSSIVALLFLPCHLSNIDHRLQATNAVWSPRAPATHHVRIHWTTFSAVAHTIWTQRRVLLYNLIPFSVLGKRSIAKTIGVLTFI